MTDVTQSETSFKEEKSSKKLKKELSSLKTIEPVIEEQLTLKQQIINQNLFSTTYTTQNGNKIDLPGFDEDAYIGYMEKLIFNSETSDRK